MNTPGKIKWREPRTAHATHDRQHVRDRPDSRFEGRARTAPGSGAAGAQLSRFIRSTGSRPVSRRGLRHTASHPLRFARQDGDHEVPAVDTTLMTAQWLFALQNPDPRIRFARSGCFAILLAMLAGCGLAEVERARMETGDAARQVLALRSPQAGPRLSTVHVIERRPYVGLTRIQPDPRAGLPARFRRADAVTLPLAGIGAAAVLAGRIEAATGIAVRFTGPPRRADDTT